MPGYDYNYSPEILDLLRKMMAKEPEDRLLASEALKHPAFHVIEKVNKILEGDDTMVREIQGLLSGANLSDDSDSDINSDQRDSNQYEWPGKINSEKSNKIIAKKDSAHSDKSNQKTPLKNVDVIKQELAVKKKLGIS
jgi:serine/threonine protein kinase